MFSKENINTIHITAGGIVSVLAFYFLGQEMLIGWVFQSLAGILYTLYFWRQRLPMMATVILGAEAILPLYGLYKWSTSINIFTNIDAIILGLTTFFVLYIAYGMFEKNAEGLLFTTAEFLNSLLYIIAIIILSITQAIIAWWIFVVVFLLTLFLVYKRKEWIAVFFQVIYIGLAFWAILGF